MNFRKPFGLIILVGILAIGSVSCNPSPPSPSSSSPVSSAKNAEGVTSTPNSTPTPSETLLPEGPPLPKPNPQGDYQRTNHLYWEVIDSDPKGVNCRMGQYTLEQMQNPASNIVLDISNWSVVGTLKQGQRFEIDLGPGGSGVVYDQQKSPWFLIAKSVQKGTPTNCFIRANHNFIKPIPQP